MWGTPWLGVGTKDALTSSTKQRKLMCRAEIMIYAWSLLRSQINWGAHIVASHCKPWRDATNEERLNGENGLLLTPSIDHLFDRDLSGLKTTARLSFHQSRIVPRFDGWVSTPQRPSMWARSPAAKSSSLISTGTRCSCNLSAASTRGALWRAIKNPIHEQRSEDVCSRPHNGLKSDIAPSPKSATSRHWTAAQDRSSKATDKPQLG